MTSTATNGRSAGGNGLAIGIVPARGGSTRVPRKNMKLLGGLPLIAHTLISARQALELDRLIVSTDEEEIADVARAETPDLPVFQHALGWLAEHDGYRPEYVIHLRPTQPFRPPAMIDEVVRLLRTSGADCVKSLVPVAQHPHKMWKLDAAGRPGPLLDTPLWRQVGPDCAGQFLEPVYWSAGLVDGIRSDVILAGSTIGQHVEPYFVDEELCAELDTPHHFVIAEAIFEHLREKGVLTV